MGAEVTDADLDRLEEFYRARGVPASIMVCPLAHPSLADRLGRRGFPVVGFNKTQARRIARAGAFSDPDGVVVQPGGTEGVNPWGGTRAAHLFWPVTVYPC